MMRAILFGLLMMIVWGGLHYYIGHRLIDESRVPRPWNYVAWGVVAGHASLSPVAFFLARRLDSSPMLDVLQILTYVGMGLFTLLFLGVVFKDGVFLVARWLGWYQPPVPDDPDRRMLLTSGLNFGIFALAGVGTGIGYVEARRRPTVDEVDVPVKDLHPDLDGLRIIQISDTHVGPTLKRAFVETVVEVVNELDADIVAVTGDLIDGYAASLRDELAPFAQMRSRHGVYYCTGNHEWYWDADAWKAEVESIGFRALANEHAVLDIAGAKLVVGGVDDYSCPRMGGTSDPELALADAPTHDFSVLLAHQPKSCYAASRAGWGLQLSGHTHGGQFFPWNFFVGLAHPFTTGLHDYEGTWVYVNRGTGYWGPPLRLGIPSEITALTLRRV